MQTNCSGRKFLHNNQDFFTESSIISFFDTCYAINPDSIRIFYEMKGENIIVSYFLRLAKDRREHYIKIFSQYPVGKTLEDYLVKIQDLERNRPKNKFAYIKKILFSDYKYYGKVFVDDGALFALQKPWLNLLPIGITKVEGQFSAGSVVGVFSENNYLVGIGISEYDAEQLSKMKGHHSSAFNEILGYFHTTSAIKNSFRLNRINRNEKNKWMYIKK
jgi:hypothetical protein